MGLLGVVFLFVHINGSDGETHHDGFEASTVASLRSVRFASYRRDGMDGDCSFM